MPPLRGMGIVDHLPITPSPSFPNFPIANPRDILWHNPVTKTTIADKQSSPNCPIQGVELPIFTF